MVCHYMVNLRHGVVNAPSRGTGLPGPPPPWPPPYTLDFNAADGGKNAHYILRWVSPGGEQGPWSETASVTIGA
jgi:hypothetical protein